MGELRTIRNTGEPKCIVAPTGIPEGARKLQIKNEVDGPKMQSELIEMVANGTTNSTSFVDERVHRTGPGYNFKIKTDWAPKCGEIEPEDIDFTLVTQLSKERLPVMREQCQRWGDHAISVAIKGNVSKAYIYRELSAMGCNENYTTITIVNSMPGDDENGYPVNALRNAAMAAVTTTHVAYTDADFLVSTDLYDDLMHQTSSLVDQKIALVIPAFELRHMCDISLKDCRSFHMSILPKDRQELTRLFGSPEQNALVYPFDAKVNPGGHNTTRYTDWFKQTKDELLRIECIVSDRYEPYLVVRFCEDLPPFQEPFTGYGENKITWFQQLLRSGYSFYQLSQSFTIHLPHKKSGSFKSWIKTFKGKGRGALEVEHITSNFYRWMESNIPNERKLPYCQT